MGALLGAVVGGTIALVSTRLSDRRKRDADDLRQWDSRLIEIYTKLDAATLVFYDTWNISEGDVRHFDRVLPSMEAAIDVMGRGVAVIEIIAPPCEAASRALREVARKAMSDAERAVPMRGERLREFQNAHAELISSIRKQIRMDSARKS
jgi:hypothetical protein